MSLWGDPLEDQIERIRIKCKEEADRVVEKINMEVHNMTTERAFSLYCAACGNPNIYIKGDDVDGLFRKCYAEAEMIQNIADAIYKGGGNKLEKTATEPTGERVILHETI